MEIPINQGVSHGDKRRCRTGQEKHRRTSKSELPLGGIPVFSELYCFQVEIPKAIVDFRNSS